MNAIALVSVALVAVCWVGGVHSVHDADVLKLYQHWSHGDGTYYGKGEAGACSLQIPHLPSVARHVDKLVALNSPQFFGSASCGACFRVNGTGSGLGSDPITGSFIVMVKDLCPECLAGSVDLAENGDGRWKVGIQAVQCPVGNAKIEYRFEGSNSWYLKMQVRNGRMPATSVDMFQPKAGVWVHLQQSRDGFWLVPSDSRVEKPIQLPFKVRLHSPTGATLVDTVHATSMSATGIIHGNGVQFPLVSSLPHA